MEVQEIMVEEKVQVKIEEQVEVKVEEKIKENIVEVVVIQDDKEVEVINKCEESMFVAIANLVDNHQFFAALPQGHNRNQKLNRLDSFVMAFKCKR